MSRIRAQHWRSVARMCERLLFAVGACCLLIYVAACAHRSLTQAEDSAEFDAAIVAAQQAEDARLRASMQAEDHDRSSWSVERVRDFERVAGEPVHALGRLEIPDASVSVMLLEGTDELTLNRAVGHIEGTALPGEGSNVGIAGHRDGFFRGLRLVHLGAPLSLTTLQGVAHYEVESIAIVEPSEVTVLEPTDEESITLVTCYPFYFVGDAPKRYIVHGKLVRFEPWARAEDPEVAAGRSSLSRASAETASEGGS